ncbi:hypothetical protein [Rubritalea profundi]|nr:hypothetical protein [Rubritalea profundi]
MTSQRKGKQGIHRMRDTNNDGKFDKIEHIVKANGHGEHGPHGVIKAPDGKNLIVVIGNHTQIPEGVKSLNGHNWAEDTLHPHLKDASGHAVRIKAPGGTLIKFSADGSEQTVIANGMRNTYDIAANTNGALFGYDSDMEYDIGTP